VYEYVFYLIDLVAAIIAIILSLTDTTPNLYVKIPLVGLSILFKYVYLVYYMVMKWRIP